MTRLRGQPRNGFGLWISRHPRRALLGKTPRRRMLHARHRFLPSDALGHRTLRIQRCFLLFLRTHDAHPVLQLHDRLRPGHQPRLPLLFYLQHLPPLGLHHIQLPLIDPLVDNGKYIIRRLLLATQGDGTTRNQLASQLRSIIHIEQLSHSPQRRLDRLVHIGRQYRIEPKSGNLIVYLIGAKAHDLILPHASLLFHTETREGHQLHPTFHDVEELGNSRRHVVLAPVTDLMEGRVISVEFDDVLEAFLIAADLRHFLGHEGVGEFFSSLDAGSILSLFFGEGFLELVGGNGFGEDSCLVGDDGLLVRGGIGLPGGSSIRAVETGIDPHSPRDVVLLLVVVVLAVRGPLLGNPLHPPLLALFPLSLVHRPLHAIHTNPLAQGLQIQRRPLVHGDLAPVIQRVHQQRENQHHEAQTRHENQ
mmetsp:Transcript_24361/g.49977  ORF Transcript_24361/g.49977 Transcript_24361/m.49977 type:complete len:420 (+) Transcript_24361:304-1563(+)